MLNHWQTVANSMKLAEPFYAQLGFREVGRGSAGHAVMVKAVQRSQAKSGGFRGMVTALAGMKCTS